MNSTVRRINLGYNTHSGLVLVHRKDHRPFSYPTFPVQTPATGIRRLVGVRAVVFDSRCSIFPPPLQICVASNCMDGDGSSDDTRVRHLDDQLNPVRRLQERDEGRAFWEKPWPGIVPVRATSTAWQPLRRASS
jgi:hypothetical protein